MPEVRALGRGLEGTFSQLPSGRKRPGAAFGRYQRALPTCGATLGARCPPLSAVLQGCPPR